MGWIVQNYREPGTSHADFFQREVLGDNYEILDSAFIGGIGGTFYAAVKIKDGAEAGNVFAYVALTKGSSGSSFGWKSMEEEMGPYSYDCPARILDLLSPTDNENALVWRNKCRERAATQDALRPGVRVTFPADYLCPEGPRREFVYEGNGRFKVPDTGNVYSLRAWRKEEYAIAS